MKELVVIFDTETCGTDWKTTSIVQFSAVAYDPLKDIRYTLMSTLCHPEVPIADEALATHGISEDMTKLSPSPRLTLLQFKLMLERMSHKYTIVLGGHNSERFDVNLCDRLCPSAHLLSYPHIDTMILARRHWPDSTNHKLGHLVSHYVYGCEEDDLEGAHDAAVDCYFVADLIPAIMKAEGVGSCVELANRCAEPQVYDTCPFGKHKGKPMSKVPVSYIDFCFRNFSDLDKDMEATFKHYLGVA